MSQSNFFDSTLVGYQARVQANYQAPELREKKDKFLEVGLNNAPFLFGVDQLTSIKESTIRPVYGYMFNRVASTGGTAPAAFNTGAQGSSTQIQLAFTCVTEEFSINLSSGLDNVFQFQAMFDYQMSEAQRNLRERLRAYGVGQLYTGRNANPYSESIGAKTKLATWNSGTNTFELGIGGANNYFRDIASVMRQNKYMGFKYDVFADPVLYAQYNFISAQGAGNATNLTYNFDSNSYRNIFEDVYLGQDTTFGSYQGYALAMPEQNFAFMPWMPKPYKDGWGDFNSYAGGYSSIADGTGLPLNYFVHGWVTQQDNSGSHGMSQDVVMQWQVGTYVAFQAAQLSTANETTIFGFGINA